MSALVPTAASQTTRQLEAAPRLMMLVSTSADVKVRSAVESDKRPRPEYLILEERYGVELFDWNRLQLSGARRSLTNSLRHVIRILPFLAEHDLVFSDGEHVGIPLALLLRAINRSIAHVIIGHHLTVRYKRQAVRWLPGNRTRFVVHSRRQLESAQRELRVPRDRLELIPYGIDTEFWRPLERRPEPVIVAAGREHRDYQTLVRATAGMRQTVLIADGSAHSPQAFRRDPTSVPDNVQRAFVDPPTLRDWYARAQVVVVPLLENDFQAGVTSILEAMACGKAVVASRTAGQQEIIDDGETGILVPPHDAGMLRRAIEDLVAHPRERLRLGRNARQAVEARFSVDEYAARLAATCLELARGD